MSVVVVGVNHRNVPLAVLEAVSVGPDVLAKALHDLAGREHVGEVAVLSTCMRTEIYATAPRFHGVVGDLRTFLADWSGLPPEALAPHLFDFYDRTACHHLLRVAAGLDSAVIGEGEILRQVRTAAEVARTEGTAGVEVDRLFRHAVATGKRVRAETAIARGTTSLSHTAVSLAGAVGAPPEAVPPEAARCPVIGSGAPAPAAPTTTPVVAAGPVPTDGGEAGGDPCPWSELVGGRSVLVIGAGEMGAAIAGLVTSGPVAGPVSVANRTDERAGDLAQRTGALAVAWRDLPAAVAAADLVFTATASPGVVVDAAMVGSRSARPLVVVDLAVPRDVAADVAGLPGVTVFDITHLRAHAEAAMEARRREVPAAEVIVGEELDRLARVTAERGLAPTVAALHARGEAVRTAELARLAARLGPLDDRQRRAVEALTRGIVAKLLHEPTVNLKAAAGSPGADRLAGAVEELFDL